MRIPLNSIFNAARTRRTLHPAINPVDYSIILWTIDHYPVDISSVDYHIYIFYKKYYYLKAHFITYFISKSGLYKVEKCLQKRETIRTFLQNRSAIRLHFTRLFIIILKQSSPVSFITHSNILIVKYT